MLQSYNVLVLGGGNAGLCAALTAREAGRSVLVVECAPQAFRGGNSRHTRNLRCMHAAPTDTLTDTYGEARSPKFDGGICTRVDCFSLGIVVNNQAQLYDEGEDFWRKRYAIWGRLVAGQPDQIGYAIIDVKAMGKFMPPVFPPIEADSIPALAMQLKLEPDRLQATIADFNHAIRPGTFDHTVLDDCATEALQPPKTHWARSIDSPPFFAYPLRPGITFTYLGVTVNERAQIIMNDGTPSDNMFAAGEIMAGNALGRGYIAGIGMSIGTAFGRIAGRGCDQCPTLGPFRWH